MKNVDKTFKAILATWVVLVIFNLCLWGGIAYVALHFIKKFW